MLKALNEQIASITRKLDNELFMTAERREKLLYELGILLKKRKKYYKTIEDDKNNEGNR